MESRSNDKKRRAVFSSVKTMFFGLGFSFRSFGFAKPVVFSLYCANAKFC